MNKPVAWRYKYDQEDTAWNFRDDEKLIKSMTRVHHIIAEPLYTQDHLEEARKLGMQQERALWNLSESTQEFESFDRTASHMAGEYVAHPANACKHGVDDGACKECYQEVTHPAELTDEEIISTMVQFDVYSSDDHLLIEAGRAILRKASEK